ncbi:MAG: 4-hydroxy-tetrahydrodipicolinate reductase [Candidatus Margulisiibacteriota bacterium]|jgi:4-hydroxy-tetrahydrodipicolinate reductase
MVKILVNGAYGKMGQEVVKAIEKEEDLKLVGQADIDDKLEDAIWFTHPDVVVDFTSPLEVKNNVIRILNSKCNAIVGTTGLSSDDLEALNNLALENNLGLIICPNFAIGAVLMMKYAAEIAKYMPTCEIIEYHHENKLDAPSGTSLKTVEMITKNNPSINSNMHNKAETELLPGVRGGLKDRIPIHSVRLPGFIAHQEVIFGGKGQTLSLRHDTTSRESFMPGVILCIRKVTQIKGLVYGLENLL